MSRYTMPPLIPGALYEFRSKPMKDAANDSRLRDGWITMINKFVREEDGQYVFITERMSIAESVIINNTDNNDAPEVKYSKPQLGETFFCFEIRTRRP